MSERSTRRWFAPTAELDSYVCKHFETDFMHYRHEKLSGKEGPYTLLEVDPLGTLTLLIMSTYVPLAQVRSRIRMNDNQITPEILLDSWLSPRGELMEGYTRELAFQSLLAMHPLHFDPVERIFYCMPLLRPEAEDSAKIAVRRLRETHNDAPRIYRPFLETVVKYAKAHHKVLKQFGRYPQRNALLGRVNTPEEVAWLRDEYPKLENAFYEAPAGAPERVWSIAPQGESVVGTFDIGAEMDR